MSRVFDAPPFDITWAVACWSTYLLAIEASHLHKERCSSAYRVQSSRLVGQAYPWLSIGSELLLQCTGNVLRSYACANQIGGRRDARVCVISHVDARHRRRRIALPTIYAMVDARFGYNGAVIAA